MKEQYRSRLQKKKAGIKEAVSDILGQRGILLTAKAKSELLKDAGSDSSVAAQGSSQGDKPPKTRAVVETFYAALELFMQKLFKGEYSKIVLDLLKEARGIGESLVQAMGLEYHRGSIEVQGLKWFKDEVKSQVTAKTWAARIFSFGIAAAMGKFSDRTQRDVKDNVVCHLLKSNTAKAEKPLAIR